MWLKFSESGSLTSSDLVRLATNRPITSLHVSSVFCVLRHLAFHLMKQSQSMLPLPSFLASTARGQKSKGVDTVIPFTYGLQMPTQTSTVQYRFENSVTTSQCPNFSAIWCLPRPDASIVNNAFFFCICLRCKCPFQNLPVQVPFRSLRRSKNCSRHRVASGGAKQLTSCASCCAWT